MNGLTFLYDRGFIEHGAKMHLAVDTRNDMNLWIDEKKHLSEAQKDAEDTDMLGYEAFGHPEDFEKISTNKHAATQELHEVIGSELLNKLHRVGY